MVRINGCTGPGSIFSINEVVVWEGFNEMNHFFTFFHAKNKNRSGALSGVGGARYIEQGYYQGYLTLISFLTCPSSKIPLLVVVMGFPSYYRLG